jgi:hypothetical protein
MHGSLFGRALPSVYCFLSGKDEDLYNEIFEIVLKNVSGRPKSITIDYEKAVENVVKQKLPMTTVNGCFFHWKQNLWKKVVVSINQLRDTLYLRTPILCMNFFL